jgi:cytochrome c biogenesis protein CcdA
MIVLVPALTTIALVDSLSIVPLCIVVLLVLLAGDRPYPRAGAFLAGIFVSYLAAGFAILFGLNALFEQLDAYFTRLWRQPDPEELVLQIIIGVVLVVCAIVMARRRKGQEKPEFSASMSPWRIFLLAAGLNMIGLPGALPYLGAIDLVLRADLPPPAMALALVHYNVVFIIPLAAIVAVRAIWAERSAPIFDAVTRFFDTWGRRLLVALILILGVVLVVDGIGWFVGHPLIPVPPMEP